MGKRWLDVSRLYNDELLFSTPTMSRTLQRGDFEFFTWHVESSNLKSAQPQSFHNSTRKYVQFARKLHILMWLSLLSKVIWVSKIHPLHGQIEKLRQLFHLFCECLWFLVNNDKLLSFIKINFLRGQWSHFWHCSWHFLPYSSQLSSFHLKLISCPIFFRILLVVKICCKIVKLFTVVYDRFLF